MMKLGVMLFSLCALSTLATAQISGIYVEFFTAGGGWQALDTYPDRNNNEPGLPSGSNASISNATSHAYRVFAVSPTTTNIGNVHISTSSSSSDPTLFIGRPTTGFFPGANRLPTAACTNLGSVSFGNGKPKVHGFILGTMTGSISAYELSRFDFGTETSGGAGTISGNITHNPGAVAGVPASNGIFAKHVDQGSVILANRSDINTIRVYDDFEGAIHSQNTAGITTVEIQGKFKNGILNLDGNINFISVSGDSAGSISIDGDVQNMAFFGHWGALPSGGVPNYDSSSITVGGDVAGTISVGGDFVGSLSADSLSNLSVTGGMYDWVSGAVADADLSITSGITALNTGQTLLGSVAGNQFELSADQVVDLVSIGGDYTSGFMQLVSGLPSGALITVNGEMGTNVTLDFPNDGLEGQVIVNSGDTSALWSGDVVVGSTTLASNYTTLSSELGGGQVGVAPFNFHQRTTAPLSGNDEDKDCDPYQGEVVTAAYVPGSQGQPGKNEVIDSVLIRHYGPVYAVGSEDHFIIEFKSDLLPSSWVDRSSLFEIDTTVTATTALGAHRDVKIMKTDSNKTGFTAAGKWRIRPNDEDLMDSTDGPLKCGDVVGNPDVGWDSNVTSGGYDWYQFRVLLEAPGGGMLLQGGTSSSDLTDWGVAPYEVNADGDTDSQDFSELADSYTGN